MMQGVERNSFWQKVSVLQNTKNKKPTEKKLEKIQIVYGDAAKEITGVTDALSLENFVTRGYYHWVFKVRTKIGIVLVVKVPIDKGSADAYKDVDHVVNVLSKDLNDFQNAPIYFKNTNVVQVERKDGKQYADYVYGSEFTDGESANLDHFYTNSILRQKLFHYLITHYVLFYNEKIALDFWGVLDSFKPSRYMVQLMRKTLALYLRDQGLGILRVNSKYDLHPKDVQFPNLRVPKYNPNELVYIDLGMDVRFSILKERIGKYATMNAGIYGQEILIYLYSNLLEMISDEEKLIEFLYKYHSQYFTNIATRVG